MIRSGDQNEKWKVTKKKISCIPINRRKKRRPRTSKEKENRTNRY